MLDRNVQWALLNEAVTTLQKAVQLYDEGQPTWGAYAALRLLGQMTSIEILINNDLFDKQAILAYNVIAAKLEELSSRSLGEPNNASKSE